MIKCEQCGKEVNDDKLWELTILGVTTYFCSNECLNKWYSVNETETITVTAKYLDEE